MAYFAVNKPVRGKPAGSTAYNDVTYYFVNGDAKRMFDRNPEQYVPAYGGWCGFGMSIEDRFLVDPTSFKIVDGRLRLFLKNRTVDARKLWNEREERSLAGQADARRANVSG